jgi:hypothetical protein
LTARRIVPGRLAEAREAAGLSTGQAARLLGRGHAGLMDDERAEALPAVRLARYADLYGCSEAWLEGATAPVDPSTLRGLSRLTSDAQAQVLSLVESLPAVVQAIAETTPSCPRCGRRLRANGGPGRLPMDPAGPQVFVYTYECCGNRWSGSGLSQAAALEELDARWAASTRGAP